MLDFIIGILTLIIVAIGASIAACVILSPIIVPLWLVLRYQQKKRQRENFERLSDDPKYKGYASEELLRMAGEIGARYYLSDGSCIVVEPVGGGGDGGGDGGGGE